jgi:hypothetical protein
VTASGASPAPSEPAATIEPTLSATLEPVLAPTPAASLAAQRLTVGQRWHGTVPGDGAALDLRFTLRAPQHLRLRVAQPPDADVEVSLAAADRELLRQRALEPGQEIDLDLWLSSGDHVLRLRPTRPAGTEYSLLLSRLDPFLVPADTEPNGDPSLAHEAPRSLRWEGGPAGAEPDVDGFWLPALTAPGDVRIVLHGEPPRLRLFADGTRSVPLPLSADDEGVLVAGQAPAGQPLYLEVDAEGPYGIELEAPGWMVTDDVLAPPLELELELDEAAGVACSTDGASLPGRLSIVDAGAQPVVLELRTASSDPGWQLRLDREVASLGPGESMDIPVRVEVAPGACPEGDVALSLAAVTAEGGLVSTTLTLEPGPGP